MNHIIIIMYYELTGNYVINYVIKIIIPPFAGKKNKTV